MGGGGGAFSILATLIPQLTPGAQLLLGGRCKPKRNFHEDASNLGRLRCIYMFSYHYAQHTLVVPNFDVAQQSRSIISSGIFSSDTHPRSRFTDQTCDVKDSMSVLYARI